MLTFRKIMTVLAAGALILSGACRKQPEAPKQIVIPASSRAVSFDHTGPQSQNAAFTAPDSWVASVTYSNGSGWVTLSPSSGSSGDVTMKVTVQANDTAEERSATVTIKSAGATASFTIRQSGKPIPVESVKLDQEKLELTEGDTATLTATVSPDNAADKSVTWSSSDAEVASVSGGKVTALKPGTATITAKAGDKTAACAVTVVAKVVPVESVSLDRETLNLTEGETATLKATVTPDDATDKTVKWSSSDKSIATVSSSGKVTAVKAGTATITAKAGDKTATCTVTVAAKVIAVTKVALDKTTLSLTEGGTATLTATVSPSNATNKTVTWTSSDKSIATVENGKVTAVKAGTATITAKAGDKTATCTVTVAAKVIAVTKVALDKTTLSLTEGGTATLTATVSPSNATNKTVTWTSSDKSIATVENGKVTAVKAGTATITAKAGDKTATCTVTVSAKVIAVTKVALDKTTLSLTEGGTATLTATVSPTNATNKTVTWTSSDKSIATVENGKVTAVKAGTATITAKAGDKTATCTVTVAAKVIAVTKVALDKTTLSLTEGGTATLTATVSPTNATNKTVTWTSSDKSIATVENGKVTAVKAGTATITAKAGDKTATCTVTVAAKVIAVTKVALDKTTLSLTEGDTATLTATVSPTNATNKTVTWTSNDKSIATVENGKVTAVKAGTATITAKAGDKTATCTVMVAAKVIAVTKVALDKTTLSLTEGGTATLTATVSPTNATNKTVTWTSSDKSIATVENGKVTAVKAGTATITAKAGDKTATCTVTVAAKVIAVTKVALDKTTLSLTEGGTATLTATVSPTNATNKTVTWTSSDKSIATVDSNGKVTAVKAGTAKITAKAGDKTATCTVTVAAKVIAVTKVALDKTTLSLTEGNTATLTATVSPSNATNKTVTWTSSDKSIATVENGKVTAVKAGTATITAKAGDKTATCTVTVAAKVIAVTKVALDKTALSLTEGNTATLTATVSPSNATNKTVTWTSSDKSIATVENGKVTAVKAGTATITAKAGDKTATCTVTVAAKVIAVTKVALDKTALSLTEGDTATLTATVSPTNATNKTVTWTSSDKSIATVDSNGKVTAVKAGTAKITAKAGDKTATCTVTVAAKVIAVTSVTLNKSSLSLTVGGTSTLSATVNPSNATDKTVTWTSSDKSVATVSSSGKVTAVAVGTATITAKAGSKTATCTVTVKPIEVTSVTLSKSSLSLTVGGTSTLTATVNPSNATDKTVTWSSSDTSIATVSSSGKVTAVAVGTATITAKAGSKTATCTVTVKPIEVTSVTLDKTTLSLQTGESTTLTATVNPSNATDKTVTWSSSDATIAYIDANGKVTAKRAGSAMITATAGEKTATCAVTVTVPSGGSEGMGEENWN